MDKRVTSNELQDRRRGVYVIFGATTSVGICLSMRLAARGSDLVLVGHDTGELSLISDSLDARYFASEIIDRSQIRDCISAVFAHYSRIDGVANCLGTEFLKSTNLSEATLKYSALAMKEHGGSIVFLESGVRQIDALKNDLPAANQNVLKYLVKSAAESYARQKIRVNCVVPTLVETVMKRELVTPQATSETISNYKFQSDNIELYPATDLVMDWLLGDDCAITGQCLLTSSREGQMHNSSHV